MALRLGIAAGLAAILMSRPSWPRPPGLESQPAAPVTFALVHAIQKGAGYVNSLALAPDGRWLVSASDDRQVKIWDVASGELVRSLRGHEGAVYAVAIAGNSETFWRAFTSQIGCLTRRTMCFRRLSIPP